MFFMQVEEYSKVESALLFINPTEDALNLDLDVLDIADSDAHIKSKIKF
jgi:hypothetical protein